jgi:parvulin-like peptidyl-prolyl isomerase
MRNIFIAVITLFSVPTFGQLTVTEQFQKINTIEQAQKYITDNPQLKPALLNLSAGKDTQLIDKRLLRQKKGDIFSVGYVTYKVIEVEDTVDFRASYIFLDGGSLAPREIDSLKKEIVQKANQGVSFAELSDQYTMDGNTTRGDTDWFFGEFMFPKEFQDAVEKHKVGEIFFVDVPEKQWHYIVKKTHPDRLKKDIVVLRANGR